MSVTTKAIHSGLIGPWLTAMLMISAVCLTSCADRQPVTVIPADRMIRELPDGKYSVTPAWLQDRYRQERRLRDQLDKCLADK